MRKQRLWRPLNTYGILGIACVTASVMLYTVCLL